MFMDVDNMETLPFECGESLQPGKERSFSLLCLSLYAC